jgi:hypothetical protein
MAVRAGRFTRVDRRWTFTAQDVDGVSDGLEVTRPNAMTNPAEMIGLQTIRDRSNF